MNEVPARPPERSEIRVLIVEEQEVLRRGLLAITSSIPEVAASAVPTICAGDTEPPAEVDVTLISTSTLLNAERAGSTIEHLRPMIVIVPSTHPDQLEIATRRRANGYVMQPDLTATSLRSALLQVRDGQLAIPEAVVAYLLNRTRGHDAGPRPELHHLSSRESEVLSLLVAGASNKEIATKLHLSIHGVKRHVSALLTQFHSPSRAHLVSHILRSGMLPPTDPDR